MIAPPGLPEGEEKGRGAERNSTFIIPCSLFVILHSSLVICLGFMKVDKG